MRRIFIILMALVLTLPLTSAAEGQGTGKGKSSKEDTASSSGSSLVAGTPMPRDLVLGKLAGEFVHIPAGEFMMGSINGDTDDNPVPVHKVSV